MIDAPILPTCDINAFKTQLSNPNTNIPIFNQPNSGNQGIQKINKSLVIAMQADNTGCSFYRMVAPLNYMNSLYGRTGKFNLLLTPTFIFQEDILMRARTIFLQRPMNPQYIPIIKRLKDMQPKFGYKLLFELDDYIWKGDDFGECIPEYNFGSEGIGEDVRKATIEIANMADTYVVTTEFLKFVMQKYGVTAPISIIPNHVPKYFFAGQKKRPIKNKIERPRVISTASPTHWHEFKKLKGDFDNAWTEWVIKNVKENKIEYFQMGGCPFFFESIKDKPNFHSLDWVDSWTYYSKIMQFRPDFSIAPLMPNYFSYCKSPLKFTEACGYGAAFIGTIFNNVAAPIGWKGTHAPSPYDESFLNVQHDCKVEDIEEVIRKNCEPEYYNEIIKKQYQHVENGLYLECPEYIKQWTDVL